jgi:hypothetical protein
MTRIFCGFHIQHLIILFRGRLQTVVDDHQEGNIFNIYVARCHDGYCFNLM